MHLPRQLRGTIDFIAGRNLLEVLAKGYRLLCREGVGGLRRIVSGLATISYREWVTRYDTLNEADRTCITAYIKAMKDKPLISVLLPTYETPPEFLEQAIASVRAQIYPHWELCIADDASRHPQVRTLLERVAREDERIRIVFRQVNGHISVASNTALAIARGEFVALLDHDDELAEHALYLVALAINANPMVDVLYSDEDKIDTQGRRFGHYFKPDWNPDLFCSQNMISHLGVYRTTLLRQIGGFRLGFEGSQDWDLALRAIAQSAPDRIHHIPHVLYHWRAIPGSTSISISAKSYAIEAARKALAEHWSRRGLAIDLDPVEPCHFNARARLPSPSPSVSVVVVANNCQQSLERCIDRLHHRTNLPVCEILIVPTGATPALINSTAARAQGTLLCLMNSDIEPLEANWLGILAAQALRPEIAAVGPRLCFVDGTLAHAGYCLYGEAASSPYCHQSGSAPGYANRARLNQNLSALSSACLVIRKSVWDAVGGYDTTGFSGTFADIDLCLRLGHMGYRHLWTPLATLVAHGPHPDHSGPATSSQDRERLYQRWGAVFDHDPAWNPNLNLHHNQVVLAEPPRVTLPWRNTEGCPLSINPA